MVVSIYYTGSPHLRVLLTQLQPQLDDNSDIYITDVTKDRSGVKIASLYGSSRCYIFVEVGNYTRQQATKFALESAIDNKHDSLLIINENSLISATFVANLRRYDTPDNPFSIISPVVIRPVYPQLPSNFKWFNPTDENLRETDKYSPNCYLRRLNKKKEKVGLLVSETVILISDEF